VCLVCDDNGCSKQMSLSYFFLMQVESETQILIFSVSLSY